MQVFDNKFFMSQIGFAGDITPPQLTGNVNNYAPTGLATSSVLRMTSDASRNVTGLTGGVDGRLVLLLNVGSFAIVLINESSSSTAANRFALGADLTIAAFGSVLLWYDSTSTRWRVAAKA